MCARLTGWDASILYLMMIGSVAGFIMDPQTSANYNGTCKDSPNLECAAINRTSDLCGNINLARVLCPEFCGFCTVVDGNWAGWSSWSSCDVTCDNGTQVRTRTCTNPPPSPAIGELPAGKYCIGSGHGTQACSMKLCPVDGSWGSWSAWGDCSVSCDVGMQRRDRHCDNPYPERNGDHCFGEGAMYRICLQGACANGGWSSWGGWSSCSASCSGGLRFRNRPCTKPSPSALGQYCPGNSQDVQTCNHQPCNDGSWSAWSRWTACRGACGVGFHTRIRTCTHPSLSTIGRNCLGNDKDFEMCEPCGAVRLVNGSHSNEGRVEVFYQGRWGTVCDDAWGNVDAGVVCRQLGFTNGTAYGEAHFGRGTGEIWLDNVECTGRETSLWQCHNRGIGVDDCSHSEDAGVSCN